jgi:hypothetical protein
VRTSSALRRPTAAIFAGLCAVLIGAATYSSAASATTSSGASATTGSGLTACTGQRPYTPTSAWNTPIGPHPTTDPRTPTWQNTLTTTGQHLTSDVDQYTIGLYCVTSDVPRTTVTFTGYYSDYTTGTRIGHGTAPTIPDLPVPTGLTPPTGTDAQIVIWDQTNGIEYGFWQFTWTNGHATATNGYATRTDPTATTATGRFADGLAGRGAGLPYLAGLVRPTVHSTGTINHALAFAYPYPSHEHTFPASKSDGKGTTGTDLPEGTHLQLDPALTTTDLTDLGVAPTALPIARALQQYGMYVVDNSGSAKAYLQDRASAAWDSTINRTILGTIPWTHFRAVTTPTDPAPSPTPSQTPSPTPTTTTSTSTSTPTSTSTATSTAPAGSSVADMTFEQRSLKGVNGASYVDGPVQLDATSPVAGVASARFPRGTSAAFLEQRFTAASEHWVDLTLRVNALATGDTRIVQSLNATGSGTVTTGSLWLRADGTLLLRNYNTTVGAPGPRLAPGKAYRLRLHQRTNADGTIGLEGYVALSGSGFSSPFASAPALSASTRSVAVVRVGSMASNNTLDASADDVRITVGPASP